MTDKNELKNIALRSALDLVSLNKSNNIKIVTVERVIIDAKLIQEFLMNSK